MLLIDNLQKIIFNQINYLRINWNDEQMNGVKGGFLSISNHCSHCHGDCSCPGEPKNTEPLFCSPD